MSDVTRLLDAAHRGDRHAAAELLPLVDEELAKLASLQRIRRRGRGGMAHVRKKKYEERRPKSEFRSGFLFRTSHFVLRLLSCAAL
jgi:hypothetical protein